MPPLNYGKGLKKLQVHVHPNLKLTKDASNLLSDLCNDLNSKLVEGSKSDFKTRKRNKDDEMTHQNAQNAVKKLMKSRVRDFAISEGQKAVFKYMNQLLRYDEKKALVPEPRDIKQAIRPIRERPPGSEYGRGLQELLTSIHQHASLTSRGKSLLCSLMSNVCNRIVTGAVEAAKGNATLRPEDVAAAVGALLSTTMYDHAHSEGMKTVKWYDEGWYVFTPKKPRTVVPQAAPQKRKLSLHATADSWQQTQKTIFNTGIKNLATDVHNGCYLENSALKKVNHMLTGVLQRLAVSAINTCIENDSGELHPLAMKSAINNVLPETMAFHAQSEAEKVLTLYKCGLIQFKPKCIKPKGEESPDDMKRPAKRRKESSKKEVKTAPSPKAKKLPLPDFTAGLRQLVAEIHEYGTFNRRAGELINKALLDLAKRLIEASIAKAQGGVVLDSQHVQSAVKELFVGRLKNHALAEGNKSIAVTANEVHPSVVQQPQAAAPILAPPILFPAQLTPSPAPATASPAPPTPSPAPVTLPVVPPTPTPPPTEQDTPMASSPAPEQDSQMAPTTPSEQDTPIVPPTPSEQDTPVAPPPSEPEPRVNGNPEARLDSD